MWAKWDLLHMVLWFYGMPMQEKCLMKGINWCANEENKSISRSQKKLEGDGRKHMCS
jgi:hypothetical protein